MKRRKILSTIALILFLAGISLLLYPQIKMYLYQREADQLIEDYNSRMEEYSEESDTDLEWLYQMLVAYNKQLYEERQQNLQDPFSYTQIDFSLVEFGFDEEMIGHLDIPQLDVRLPVYLGASEENLSRGAAHLTQTSMPVGGINTNAVIAAHRGHSTAAMFRQIEKLQTGDRITFTNFRETLTYEVSEIKIINPDEIKEILIQEGRDLITLITCHPYRYNYQRYIVYCERVV